MHGILGALLLMPVAWFLALFLVREGIKGNIEQQRQQYDVRVARGEAPGGRAAARERHAAVAGAARRP